jgi:PTH1 family peptidyl-tRNA hydrolase
VKLVVGLGNPGPEYEWTRHNVGFHAVDAVAKRAKTIFEAGRGLEGWRGRSDFEFAPVRWPPAQRDGPPTALLVKPLGFMNRSGDVVAPLLLHLGLTPAELLVVTDDLDLPLGVKRIRPHGSAGTHNGLRSIVNRLAAAFPAPPQEARPSGPPPGGRFPRLRIGIGAAGTDAARHVLERFSGPEQVEIEIAVAEAADALLDWLQTGDIDGCMTRYHSRWNRGA